MKCATSSLSSLVLGALVATANAQPKPPLKTPPPVLKLPKFSGIVTDRPSGESTRGAHPTALVRVEGAYLGTAAAGRRLLLVASGKTLELTVFRWTDTALHTRIPSPIELGIWQKTGNQKVRLVLVETAKGKPPVDLGVRLDVIVAWGHKWDKDGDAVTIQQGDCNDYDNRVHPGRTETADTKGLDDDCNPNTIGTLDLDHDGFTDARVFNVGGKRGNDCDDSRPEVHPGQIEACNRRDDDCDGQVDEELLNCPK
jgi:hypothetical protein